MDGAGAPGGATERSNAEAAANRAGGRPPAGASGGGLRRATSGTGGACGTRGAGLPGRMLTGGGAVTKLRRSPATGPGSLTTRRTIGAGEVDDDAAGPGLLGPTSPVPS